MDRKVYFPGLTQMHQAVWHDHVQISFVCVCVCLLQVLELASQWKPIQPGQTDFLMETNVTGFGAQCWRVGQAMPLRFCEVGREEGDIPVPVGTVQ